MVAARAAEETPSGPIVELPKFVVTDSRELPKPEMWRYATMPGFEILTNASDKATQRLIRDFDMFRQALGHVWPLPQRSGPPTLLILCGKGGKFDAFAPKEQQYETALASRFLKKSDRTAIVIDFQATTLNVLNIDGADDAATGTDSGVISVEHDKQLYREYVHYLLSRSEPRLPAWLEEGLSQIIMRMKFDRRWIEFARLEDPNTVSAQAAFVAEINAAAAAEGDASLLPGAPAEDRDFNVSLRRRALVPLEKFFAVGHESPEAMNPLGNNRWAKQAYAFVHMCLYGYNGKYQKAFSTFIQRAAREPVTEPMFKECFNMTYSKMLLEIRSYCEFTVYEHKEYRAKQDVIIPPPPLALRDATQSEVGRIKGEALTMAGNNAAARAELIAPYIRGERDPALLASLGLYERAAGEDERARKFLEAAVAGKAVRAEAYYELARYRFADAQAKPGGANGGFSAAQSSGIIELLLTARKQPPAPPAVYDLMAETWARSPTSPKRDDIIALIEGVRLYPGRLKLAYQVAALSADGGMPDVAHSLVDHGIKYAPDITSRARFEELKKKLPPAPVTPPAK
ncbi:MAG TPA: hypothetical protein VM029_13245 [Opitutaceae bacterium]|nr:hypothetical protein [Opitutaceae bacterium]